MPSNSEPRAQHGLLLLVLLVLGCSLTIVSSSAVDGYDPVVGSAVVNQYPRRRSLQSQTAAPTASALASDPTGPLNNITSSNVSVSNEGTVQATEVPASQAPSEFPPSVDIVECRKHLQVVDVDRNNMLSEQEYFKFVHEIVSHDYNHTMANVPGDSGGLVWGNKFSDLPPPLQANYHNLSLGGAIEILGYKPLPPGQELSLAHKLFLVKVCVHTQVAVNQARNSMAFPDAAPQDLVIPEVEVLVVYSSFSISNKVGIHSVNLMDDVDGIRTALVAAYQVLVTQVVSELTGVPLTNPGVMAENANSRSSAGTVEGREANRNRRRRRLTVAVDPQLPQVYTFQDVACPGVPANITSSLLTEWCQIAYANFMLYLVAEESIPVYEEYSGAMQDAAAQGRLQTIFQQANPNAEVKVTGAGPTLLPPPPTAAPTHLPQPSPTVSPQPHSMVVPEESTTATTTPKKKDLGLIFGLAGTLLMVNLCIIGSSIYICVKNRNNPQIPDFDDDDQPMEGMNDAYYNNIRKSSKKKRTKDRRVRYDDQSESQSNPPTLEDIAEANSYVSAPAPAPMAMQDAQERERILRGQGSSYHTTTSNTSDLPPTREEIHAALHRAGAVDNSTSAPPNHYEQDEKLPFNAGEMA